MWITMGLIHNPANAHKRPVTGFRTFWLPYHHPMPENAATDRENGIAGDSPDEENPAHGGARKNPTGYAVGLVRTGGLITYALRCGLPSHLRRFDSAPQHNRLLARNAMLWLW